MGQQLPPTVVERTRNWAFDTFNFGEWFEVCEIADFIRREFGYSGKTPATMAQAFIKRGVENRDFERRGMRSGQLRWIAHPAEPEAYCEGQWDAPEGSS